MDAAGLEELRLALPSYLSSEDKRDLLAQLVRYPDTSGYFGRAQNETEPVQGDAWRGFTLIEFQSGRREVVVGVVVSNSCDIAAVNEPTPDQNVLFAPLLDLRRYGEFLAEIGKTSQQVGDTLAAIRRQQIHRIFYMPPMHGIMDESFIALDALYAQPLHSLSEGKLTQVFSLSNFGWYMLLFKLSLHFMRMDERVRRVSLTS